MLSTQQLEKFLGRRPTCLHVLLALALSPASVMASPGMHAINPFINMGGFIGFCLPVRAKQKQKIIKLLEKYYKQLTASPPASTLEIKTARQQKFNQLVKHYPKLTPSITRDLLKKLTEQREEDTPPLTEEAFISKFSILAAERLGFKN